jgi:hemoglobin-like flavoprotein
VRATFAKIAPISDQAAAMFYEKLFAIDPSLRPMFINDMKKQGQMLMAVLATAVGNLHRLDQILPKVRELGRRHARYGVEEKDYDRSPSRFFQRSNRRSATNSPRPRKARGSPAIRRLPGR